jgi:hypothetical protein
MLELLSCVALSLIILNIIIFYAIIGTCIFYARREFKLL